MSLSVTWSVHTPCQSMGASFNELLLPHPDIVGVSTKIMIIRAATVINVSGRVQVSYEQPQF